MDLIVINNPADLSWQTNLFDLLVLTMFLSAVLYSVVQCRRGRRIDGAASANAIVYGLILEPDFRPAGPRGAHRGVVRSPRRPS